MTRLQLKKQALESQISDLQSQLKSIEDKERRGSFKRNRKALRKKMVKDPMYQIMVRMERQLFEGSVESIAPGQVFSGLLAQLTS